MTSKSGKKSVFVWEICGALFIIGFGSLLHFFYAWSGHSYFIGLFAPVNESVWEHLKLGFWPMALYAAAEFPFARKTVNNFLLAKFLGVAALELVIVLVFHAYTSITARPILAIDISSFVFSTLVCQGITVFIYIRTKPAPIAGVIGGTGLAILAFFFMLFTYVTPRAAIFRDFPTGGYGPVRTEIRK